MKGNPRVSQYLLPMIPSLFAIAVFEVEYGRLGYVNTVCHNGYKETNDGTQYPALGSIKQDDKSSPEILPVLEALDSIGICYAVADPVGGSELVIPNALILKYRPSRIGPRFRAVGEGLN